MPRKKSENPKTAFIRARVTKEMKEELNSLLALENKSEADFLREMALAYINIRRTTQPMAPASGSGSAGAPAVPQVYIGDPLPGQPRTWTGSPLPDLGATISSGGTVGAAFTGAIAFHGDPKTNGVHSTAG